MIANLKMRKITESNKNYHANKEYISSSGLRKYKSCPEKYLAYINEGDIQTPSKVFGSLYHTLILEPEKLKEEYYTEDDRPEIEKSMASKHNSLWKKNLDKPLLSNSMVIEAKAMKERLKGDERLKGLIDKGMNEVSYYSDDLEGVKVKIRPDKITKNAIIDLKTTTDASVEGFTRTVFKYGYHVQAALYLDVLKQFDPQDRQFVFVVQEKTAPYSFQLFRCDDEVIRYGREEYRELLKIHKECVEKNSWGGYETRNETSEYGVATIELPYWLT